MVGLIMLKIDDDFVDRFLASLPKQEVGVNEDGNIVPITRHWIGEMVEEAFESPDPSCERFCRLVKANMHLFQEYARRTAETSELSPELQATFMLELISMFAFKVAKRAHKEAIERMEEGDESAEE